MVAMILTETKLARGAFVPAFENDDWFGSLKETFADNSRLYLNQLRIERNGAHQRLAAVNSMFALSARSGLASNHIPRNIHGTITGKWRLSSSVPSSDLRGAGDLTENVSLSIDGSKKTIQVPRYKVYQLGLHESFGFALLALIQRPAPRLLRHPKRHDTATTESQTENQAAIDVVFGDLLLRDGQYRGTHDRWLNVLGLYSFPDGTLVLSGDSRFRPRGVMDELYQVYQKLPAFHNRQQPLDMNQFEKAVVEALEPPRSSPDEMNSTMMGLTTRLTFAQQGERSLEKSPNAALLHWTGTARSSASGTEVDNGTLNVTSTSEETNPRPDFAKKPTMLCPVRLVLHVEKLFEEHNTGGGKHPNPSDFAGGVLLSLAMRGQLDTSDACRGGSNMLLELSTADTIRILSAAQRYSLVAILFCITQIAVILKQMESTNTQASASKISMLSVGMQAIMDAYMCLMHLVFGVAVQAVFNAFATASFFYFVIFSVFEMRYLLMIWKARSWRVNNAGWDSIRRELSLLYSRFYAALLLGVVAVYHMQKHLDILIFVMYSYWLPQIFRTAYLDTRRSFLLPYALLMSTARLLTPLYFLGCPSNFMHLRPRPRFCIGLASWTFFQVIWMETQARWGGRWFIPKRFRPPKYEYNRPFAALSQGDCVICMQALEGSPDSIMVAPCDHAFHSECLLKWMDIKLECPTCRRVLPVP
jgi:hypothetical protein